MIILSFFFSFFFFLILPIQNHFIFKFWIVGFTSFPNQFERLTHNLHNSSLEGKVLEKAPPLHFASPLWAPKMRLVGRAIKGQYAP
jgi:hypothetical protein